MTTRTYSDPFKFKHRALVDNVAGVKSGCRFEQQNAAFFFGDRAMFDSARHDYELALFDPFMPIAKLHSKAAFDDKEHLIFVFVMVKYEFALELAQLDHLAVQLGSDAGLPGFVDLGKFFGDVDFVHFASSMIKSISGSDSAAAKASQESRLLVAEKSRRFAPAAEMADIVWERRSARSPTLPQGSDCRRARSSARRAGC
jgi:hypothetical protein